MMMLLLMLLVQHLGCKPKKKQPALPAWRSVKSNQNGWSDEPLQDQHLECGKRVGQVARLTCKKPRPWMILPVGWQFTNCNWLGSLWVRIDGSYIGHLPFTSLSGDCPSNGAWDEQEICPVLGVCSWKKYGWILWYHFYQLFLVRSFVSYWVRGSSKILYRNYERYCATHYVK